MKKRIQASLLSVVMVLTMLPTALAAEGLAPPTGDPSQDGTVCICEALCIEETVNASCPGLRRGLYGLRVQGTG